MIFVCSDIHGNYEVYKKAVDKLSVNDTLYILGDVIDRGPDGITIIQDMMLRDNVHFLVGNHEWMLLTSALFNWDDGYVGIWTNPRNGGLVTMKALYNLPANELNLVIDWLKTRPLYERLEINGSFVNLVHGMYNKRLNELSGTSFAEIVNKYDHCDCYKGSITFDTLWNSPFKNFPITEYKKDELYIHGHVPVLKLSDNLEPLHFKNIINIDGGLMYGGGLILYNLTNNMFDILK